MTGVNHDSSIFDDMDQAICEQKLRNLRPTIGRKSSQDEVDTLKMIMLSQSPQSFPIHYHPGRGSSLS